MDLPKPQVVRCFFESNLEEPLPAMELRWDADLGAFERTWYLPDKVSIKGPAPHRFGVTIRRTGENAYNVRLLWNCLCLNFDELSRTQIMTTSLTHLLNALGTDVWYLLNQPLENAKQAA
jgi:hypothetical protein